MPGIGSFQSQAQSHVVPPSLSLPSDLPAELRAVNGSQKCIRFTSTVASQLLLVSLLEHLCHMYAQNPARSRCLFQLCRTFTKMGLLTSFAFCDELSTLRLQHNRAITELMKAAYQQILDGELDNRDSSEIRKDEVLFEAQTSRYINDFDEISKLGEGGYGKVFKVKNKLDGQFYAIKKILIKKVTKRDCVKVLREVKVLAGLQHPNIVGYHTAWFEHVLQAAYPKGKNQQSVQNEKSSSSIIFADNTSENPVSKGGGEHMKMSECELSTDSQEGCINMTASRSVCFKNHSTHVPHSSLDKDVIYFPCISLNDACIIIFLLQVGCHLILHIQMQLCEISLWDWIADRNKGCGEKSEEMSRPYHLVDISWTLKFFQQLLDGVYYMHNMGVMHRDIKPRNIFLYGSDRRVRIGDFGLACRDIIQEDTDHWLNVKTINGLTHTSGVGTCLYASPEQLKGSHYDFKSDMYSVGVILLELLQPFGTEMERTQVLTGLRNGHVPGPFSRKWPVQTKYIKLLTSKVSSQRPSAAQLLQSELFHNSENVICNLQQKVMQQEQEIEKLKEKIKLLSGEKDKREDGYKHLGSPV
uniref:Eukaryotic translation initiation factor 2-alpha kinase 1 n=1 Tax=Sphenodon punctatus TaxID=8508 RepID=A0A8D0GCS7_SPHPU